MRPDAPLAEALVGIGENGTLFYAEPEAGSRSVSASEWRAMSTALGVTSPLLLAERLVIRLEEGQGGDGGQGVALRRVAGPGGRRLFSDTPVVPPQVWAIRQIAPVALTPAR
jgi:hypothetical protein